MKIVSIGVCGPNEKYLKENLEDRKRLADEVLIVGNNTDKESEELIKSYGFHFYRDDREWGRFQPAIKTDLLKKAGQLDPYWILASDMDELYDSAFTREEAEKLVQKGGIGYYFYVVNFWNDREHYHKGFNFWNVRFYRYAPEYGLDFQKKALHCGLGPPMVYYWGNYAPFLLKHYGLMDEAERMRKVKRYELYDPNAKYKDRSYYDNLKVKHGGTLFNENELRKRVEEEVKKYKHKEVGIMENGITKYVWVKRLKDGKTLDMTEAEWLRIKNSEFRSKEFEFQSEFAVTRAPEVKVAPPPIQEDPLECGLCPFIGKNAKSVVAHKRKAHGKNK